MQVRSWCRGPCAGVVTEKVIRVVGLFLSHGRTSELEVTVGENEVYPSEMDVTVWGVAR